MIINTPEDLRVAPAYIQQRFAYSLLQQGIDSRWGMAEAELRGMVNGYIPPPPPVEYTPPEPEPLADWDGFIAEIISDKEFNQYLGGLYTVAPAVAGAMPSVFAKAQENLVLFLTVFESMCSLAKVPGESRNSWASLASKYNLPQAFINGIDSHG